MHASDKLPLTTNVQTLFVPCCTALDAFPLQYSARVEADGAVLRVELETRHAPFYCPGCTQAMWPEEQQQQQQPPQEHPQQWQQPQGLVHDNDGISLSPAHVSAVYTASCGDPVGPLAERVTKVGQCCCCMRYCLCMFT